MRTSSKYAARVARNARLRYAYIEAENRRESTRRERNFTPNLTMDVKPGEAFTR